MDKVIRGKRRPRDENVDHDVDGCGGVGVEIHGMNIVAGYVREKKKHKQTKKTR